MRKIFNKLVVLIGVCIVFFIVFACKHHNDKHPNSNEDNYIKFEHDGYLEQAEIELKQKLVNIAKIGGYKIDYTSVEKSLKDFFNSEIKVHLNLSSDVTILEEQTSFVSVKPLLNHNRSSKIEECTEVEFRRYSISSGNFKGYAITSPDIRIGNILVIIESEYNEDISACPFAIDYMQRLELYVQHVADLWNSITDDDLDNTLRNIVSQPTAAIIIQQQDYEFTDWEKHTGNDKFILTTKWNQNPSPFNTCVVKMIGNGVNYVGCATVQVGQIMAFHKYPENLTSKNLSKIKEKWALASEWDGKYNWNLIRKIINSSTTYSNQEHIQIASLLYDIAIGCKAEFQVDETIVFTKDKYRYLSDVGYTYDSLSNYSLNKIKSSIDSGCPVPITGWAKINTEEHSFLWFKWNTKSYEIGHSFIVDGYYNMSCKGTKKEETTSIDIIEDFVHCNVGWGGFQNGYYLSGVFAMDDQHGPLLPTRAAQPSWDKYYQYNLIQLNKLRPKR